MDSPDLLFGVCLIFGIALILISGLIIALSLPLATGRFRSRDYNYRPYQPIKISKDTADMVNKKATKWVVAWGIIVMIIGLGAVIIGITKNSGPFGLSINVMLLVFYLIPVISLLLIGVGALVYALWLQRKVHS